MLFKKRGTPEEQPDESESEIPERSPEEMVRRLAAEIDNMRKRKDREVSSAKLHAKMEVLRELLTVADSLEAALLTPGAEEGEWAEGLRATYSQTMEAFRRCGLEIVTPEPGDVFDPTFHEAVAALESAEREEGQIIDVLRKGYRMAEGEILRPAQVVVAR